MNRLIHFRIAEYEVLIAAADVTGHYGVAVLLECVWRKVALVQRTRQTDPQSTGTTVGGVAVLGAASGTSALVWRCVPFGARHVPGSNPVMRSALVCPRSAQLR
jgi:hypothetical protein